MIQNVAFNQMDLGNLGCGSVCFTDIHWTRTGNAGVHTEGFQRVKIDETDMASLEHWVSFPGAFSDANPVLLFLRSLPSCMSLTKEYPVQPSSFWF